MVARLGIVAVGLMLAACGSSGRHPSSAAACGQPGAFSLAVTQAARVYASGQAVYGCALGSGKTYRLGERRLCMRASRVGPIALAGALAAYGSVRCGVDTGNAQVVVRRLTDGEVLSQLPATTRPLGPESYRAVTDLVLKADGAVAWIATGSSIVRHGRDIEVHKKDARGFLLLDAGGAIGAGSLVLSGSRVTWKHGTAVRQATLS